MSFERPGMLLLAGLLPLLLGVLLALFVRRRRHVAAQFGDRALILRIAGTDLHTVPRLRVGAVLLAAAALGIAAAGPSWGAANEDQRSAGGDVVLVLDVSNSMLARDVAPNRLEEQRRAARALLDELRGVAVGVVVFAGRAFTLSPPTLDRAATELYLDALDPGIVTQTGSSLAAAIRQGTALLAGDGAGEEGGTLILISDGDALEDRTEILQAAERATRRNVRIFTAGVGTERGATIPDVDPVSGRTTGSKRDPTTGELAVSRLDEPLLREIADRTGGEYVQLGSGSAIELLASRLSAAGSPSAGSGSASLPPSGYAWFVGLALLLLVLDALQDGSVRRGMGIGILLRYMKRRTTWLPLLIPVGMLTGCSAWQSAAGDRAFRAGEYPEAAAAYRSALQRDTTSAGLHYNLGTALLRAGDFAAARRYLARAAGASRLDLRQRALYNLGNTDLEPAFAGHAEEALAPRLERAIDVYRQALLMRPGDFDAKWNLELAERLLQREQREEQSAGGGGGGGEGGDESAPARPDPQPRPADASDGPAALSSAEALQLLDALEPGERELQRAKLQRSPATPPGVRDW